MSIVIGATLRHGALIMADTYATYNPPNKSREVIPEGRDKMRSMGEEVCSAVVGMLPESSAIADSLARDRATLTTPDKLYAAQEERVAATWADLVAHPPEDSDPQTVAVGLVTVGVLGGCPFLAGSFRQRLKPDFHGPLYAKPWATWIMGAIHDIDCRDGYYDDFLAALYKHPRDPVAAILAVGWRAIVRICRADPSYQLTPAQAAVIEQGKPLRRLLLVASNEDPRRCAVLEAGEPGIRTATWAVRGPKPREGYGAAATPRQVGD